MTTHHQHYQDFPLTEIADAVERLIRQGATIHQKWSCSRCGLRLIMDEPNKLFTEGYCQECGTTTNIAAQGCNYLAVMRIPK